MPPTGSPDTVSSTSPVVPSAPPQVEEHKVKKTIPSRYSSAQQKKVAHYAQFHGGRAASRHYKSTTKMFRDSLKASLMLLKTHAC